LLLQGTGKTFICRQERHSTDRPIARPPLRQQPVDDERLMGAMKVAHPDVHDADSAIRTIVGRALHVMR
jgi:hypothetical protein